MEKLNENDSVVVTPHAIHVMVYKNVVVGIDCAFFHDMVGPCNGFLTSSMPVQPGIMTFEESTERIPILYFSIDIFPNFYRGEQQFKTYRRTKK